jgi:hypothetical protein
MKLSLHMSLLLESYAGFISRVASFYLSYLGEEVFDFLQVALFFSECMTCYCLLCHAFVKCFIFFKSTGSHPVLKTCKTFHEISFIAPSVECDPSLGFLKRRNSFWLQTGPLTMNFSYFKMHIVRIDKLYFYLEINLQVIYQFIMLSRGTVVLQGYLFLNFIFDRFMILSL